MVELTNETWYTVPSAGYARAQVNANKTSQRVRLLIRPTGTTSGGVEVINITGMANAHVSSVYVPKGYDVFYSRNDSNTGTAYFIY